MLTLMPLKDHSSKRTTHQRGEADTDASLDTISRFRREVGLNEASSSGDQVNLSSTEGRE